ncbi:MFS transporter [Enteractinococcus coprophilus]|uniref:Putative MFS family arabinose efflux permease n=1 Tax=Enteractinococcus coprophilus TaxID=1027633 RepID=A0A543AMC1_9MICC|nr:MFS transporter [Enteractinococcus coprophilus]TQL73737.1 putative MFS family arabinose efflux permease [Enteractinococcus coprophilus]
MKKRSTTPLPGWLWLMVTAGVLTQTTANLVRPVTSYKLILLGWGETEIGIATAAYALLPLFVALPFGRLQARLRSPRNFVALGVLILATGAAYLALTNNVIHLMIASAVLGVGHLMFTIGGQSMVARRSRATQMDANFGWFTASFSVGQMLGPLLSGVLLGGSSLAEAQAGGGDLSFSIDLALWIGAITSIVAVPVLYVLRSTQPPPTTATQDLVTVEPGMKPSALNILRLPGIASHMLAALALLAILDILVAFMPLVGESVGVSPLVIGALLATRGATSVLSRIFIRPLSARFSRNTLVLVALLVSAVAIAVVPAVLGFGPVGIASAFVCMTIGGFTLGVGQPMTMTLISQAVPRSWRGTALALRLMGNRIGQVTLPIVASLVTGPVGPAGGIWFACAVLGISGAERLINKRTGPNVSPR